MDDAELLRLFESGQLPPGGFHHEQHVRVAWNYLRRAPLPLALERFCDALKRFAIAQGKPDLFHATITTAYVLLIHERLRGAEHDDWGSFAAPNRDLFQWNPSILDRYYTPETLKSQAARALYVPPDRLPAALPPLQA